MQDDFNTAGAVAVLFDLAREINRLKDADEAAGALAHGALMKRLGGVLGLLRSSADEWLKRPAQPVALEAAAGTLSDAQIDALVVERTEARKAKNFARSDEFVTSSPPWYRAGRRRGATSWRRG